MRLRTKLGPGSIRTIRGVGYRLVLASPAEPECDQAVAVGF